MAIEKLKSWVPFWIYQLNSTANLANLANSANSANFLDELAGEEFCSSKVKDSEGPEALL